MAKAFQTEFDFELPQGYVDDNGDMHRTGKMRLATAADEILPMKDPRVQQNPAYLSVILLSRVVSSLGTVQSISPHTIEGLFAADFTFLHDMYNRINQTGSNEIEAVCPKCKHEFKLEVESSGE